MDKKVIIVIASLVVLIAEVVTEANRLRKNWLLWVTQI